MNSAVKRNRASLTIFEDLKRLGSVPAVVVRRLCGRGREQWVGGRRVWGAGSRGPHGGPGTLASPGSVWARCVAWGVCGQNRGEEITLEERHDFFEIKIISPFSHAYQRLEQAF